MTVHERATCIGCGDALPAERVELGYRYCTKGACQAAHRRGLTVTTVGVNKSADTVVATDVRRHGAAATPDAGPDLAPRRAQPGRDRAARSAPVTPAAPRRGRWTAQQEEVVRLYHDMGLSPRQIAERAGRHTPRLGITERLAVQILSAAPRR